MLPIMIPLFAVEFVIAGALNALHFWMKAKLIRAGLPVVWFMWSKDDWRMWNTYRSEAPVRDWPVWPFFAYRLLAAMFIVVGVGLVLACFRG
jgi:hypothetical protein